MNGITLYSINNWHLVRYLWPNGTMNDNKYVVYLDTDSKEYATKLRKLRAVSPYLADAVAVWTEVNGIVFKLECAMDYPKPVWPYSLRG